MLVLVLILAALLEAAQVFQSAHIASVGDALVIYVGGSPARIWSGAHWPGIVLDKRVAGVCS